MLRALPLHVFSNTFSVRDGDREIARLSMGWLSDKGSSTVDDRKIRLRRERLFSGAFELELDGIVIAKAYKPSIFRNRFDIELENVRLQLERESVFSRSFVVRKGADILGRIDPVSIFTRKARIDLPDEWPTALQLFVFWLVLIIWKRMNST